MAKARSLRFGLQLSALFGGQVKLTEITLIDPVIAVPQSNKASKGAAGTAAGASGMDSAITASEPSASTGWSSRTGR